MKPSHSRRAAWLALVISAALATGCSVRGKESQASPSGSPSYLQLKLALHNRRGLAQRIHLRFAPGDDSYNYIKAGQVYIGLFRDPALVEKGKALVRRECPRLSGVLRSTTLAGAELRPEDSAAFMDKLIKGELHETFAKPESVGKLTVACSEPEGGAWHGAFEFATVEEIGPQFDSLIDEAMAIGDAAVAGVAAAKKKGP